MPYRESLVKLIALASTFNKSGVMKLSANKALIGKFVGLLCAFDCLSKYWRQDEGCCCLKLIPRVVRGGGQIIWARNRIEEGWNSQSKPLALPQRQHLFLQTSLIALSHANNSLVQANGNTFHETANVDCQSIKFNSEHNRFIILRCLLIEWINYRARRLKRFRCWTCYRTRFLLILFVTTRHVTRTTNDNEPSPSSRKQFN